MRPKSMATVVVVLSPVWVRSSMPALADVITASVRSGLISETAPTNVVLPTPKPPATTIFALVVERPWRPAPPLELAKSTEHPFEQCHVRLATGVLVAARLVDGDESRLRQVGDEDAGHAEGNGQECGDLGHRLDLTAQIADPLMLGQLPLHLVRLSGGVHQRLDGELVPGPGPPARHGVRADQRVVRGGCRSGLRRLPLRLHGHDAGRLRLVEGLLPAARLLRCLGTAVAGRGGGIAEPVL
ncbi:hypothetical protein DUI70_1675 [Streptomyces albus]|nr:hypothetical protein DUI70_1675 [Streptomyces albus]